MPLASGLLYEHARHPAESLEQEPFVTLPERLSRADVNERSPLVLPPRAERRGHHHRLAHRRKTERELNGIRDPVPDRHLNGRR